MPATRLTKKYSDPMPEIDVLKAFIRERMATKGHRMSCDELSRKMGISAPRLHQLMNDKPTEEWKPEQRRAACRALGLDENDVQIVAIVYRKLREK